MPTQAGPPQHAAPPPQARAMPPQSWEMPLPPAREVPPQAREVLPPMQMAPPAREAAPPRPQAHAVSPAAGMAGPRPEPNPTEVRRPEPVRYDIGQQHGQVISNVGRDQYNAHVQQVIQQRESFLREIARTKTKARWLVWLGLLLFVGGFALFAAADVNFLKQIANDVQNNGNTAPPTDPFGRPIGGIPSGLLGWAIAAVGALMLMIGIVLHIVATSRRRRVAREYPVPMPWPPGGPGGMAR
jgi:hypothetical protein